MGMPMNFQEQEDQADAVLLRDLAQNFHENHSKEGEPISHSCSCGCGDPLHNHHHDDEKELLDRIRRHEELLSRGEVEVAEELARDCLTMGLNTQEEGDEEGSDRWYRLAIQVIQIALHDQSTPQRIRMYGLAQLGYAVMLNDNGRTEEALVQYQGAADALSQLADRGDVEADLDLAGIELNVATILFEMGEPDCNLHGISLDMRISSVRDHFLRLTKGERGDDARFYLAKTLLLEAAVREVADPNGAVLAGTQACNHLRQLVDTGHNEYLFDLAEALAGLAERFSMAPESVVYDPNNALALAHEATGYFHQLAKDGDVSMLFDEIDASLLEAGILFSLENYSDSLALYDRILDEVKPYGNLSEDFSSRLAEGYSGRAKVERQIEHLEDARDDWGLAIEVYNELLAKPSDPNDEEQVLSRNQIELSQMLDRIFHAEISVQIGDKRSALDDINMARQTLDKLKDFLGTEYIAYRQLFDKTVQQIR